MSLCPVNSTIPYWTQSTYDKLQFWLQGRSHSSQCVSTVLTDVHLQQFSSMHARNIVAILGRDVTNGDTVSAATYVKKSA